MHITPSIDIEETSIKLLPSLDNKVVHSYSWKFTFSRIEELRAFLRFIRFIRFTSFIRFKSFVNNNGVICNAIYLVVILPVISPKNVIIDI